MEKNELIYKAKGRKFDKPSYAKAWSSRYSTRNQTPTVREYELVPTGRVYQKRADGEWYIRESNNA